jgi:hypothetical protein
MVDFNNETTITTPSLNIIKVLRLERRYNLIESLEVYYRAKALGDSSQEIITFKARLLGLVAELEGEISRHLSAEQKKVLDEQLSALDDSKLLLAWSTINLLLDKLGLTKMDTKTKYDETRTEIENKIKKL